MGTDVVLMGLLAGIIVALGIMVVLVVCVIIGLWYLAKYFFKSVLRESKEEKNDS